MQIAMQIVLEHTHESMHFDLAGAIAVSVTTPSATLVEPRQVIGDRQVDGDRQAHLVGDRQAHLAPSSCTCRLTCACPSFSSLDGTSLRGTQRIGLEDLDHSSADFENNANHKEVLHVAQAGIPTRGYNAYSQGRCRYRWRHTCS